MARFRAGATFIGRYVLSGVIGQGGVSVVYRAVDLLNDRPVAIKMLDSTVAGDSRARERIRREAIITDRMRHPSVPKVYDYGEASQSDGTTIAYVVLELLEGTVLSSYLDDGPLPWLDAVGVAAAVADVLAVAHKRGVVHRDLTATNIMITDDGARILDFGVAVTVQTPDRGTFVQSTVRPSNDFAGPGEPADDVYALGVLLYQMVTGATAKAPPPTATAAMRIAAPVVVADDVPRPVADICRRCTASRPTDRPDAASVALDLWSLIVPMEVPLTAGPYDLAVRPALAPATPPPLQLTAAAEPAYFSESDHGSGPGHDGDPGRGSESAVVARSAAEVLAGLYDGPQLAAREIQVDDARHRRTRSPWSARSNGHRTVDRAQRRPI